MSKPILEQLFDGEIYPSEQIDPSSPRYDELARLIDETQTYFLKSLSESDRERFTEHCEMYGEMQTILAVTNFTYGYKLGVRMTSEAFIHTQSTKPKKNKRRKDCHS